jgi:hypothetical protein
MIRRMRSMIDDGEDFSEHRGHRRMAKPEPSTYLRELSILAQRIEGDFILNSESMIINTHHLWIAEGKTQEEIHSRYVTATLYIIGAVVSEIEKIRNLDPKNKVVIDYDDLVSEMNTCGVVSVSSTHDESGGSEEFTLDTFASISDPAKKNNDESKATLTPMSKSRIECLPAQFEIAFHEARENGFMRVNCGAREHYQKAFLLWKKLKPDDGKISIKATGPHADDFRRG